MVILKHPEEIEKIRAGSLIVAEVLRELRSAIRPGITTKELDNLAEDLSHRKSARPAFKGYMGYPFSLCTSVNEEVVHGLPSDRVLVEGDIISLDFGAKYAEFFGEEKESFS